MTWETCLKQAKNCRAHGDEEGALMYEARANRKKNRDAAYYEMQAVEAEKMGNSEGAAKWRAIAEEKRLTENSKKPAKEGTDGKKPKR